jgi:hypothetical protein
LNGRITELETIHKMNVRNVYMGINEFRKGYKPKINLVKDEKGGLLADCHSILSGWSNNFCY